MKLTSFVPSGLLLAAVFSSLSGCAIESAIDCNSICTRYQSCFDHNYDVASCASRCRTNAANSTDYRRTADTCNACITDRACTSAVFNCGTECSSVVP